MNVRKYTMGALRHHSHVTALLTALFTISTPIVAIAQDIPKRPGSEHYSGSIRAGDLDPLTGPEMTRVFNGQVMRGVYKDPRAKSGTQFFTEEFKLDGTTAYREGEITDSGRWQTLENMLCFSYEGTMSGPPSCFAVFRIGTCYYSYSPHELLFGKPPSPNSWSVKSKLDGDLSTCEDLTS